MWMKDKRRRIWMEETRKKNMEECADEKNKYGSMCGQVKFA